jgi:hypothetical protein
MYILDELVIRCQGELSTGSPDSNILRDVLRQRHRAIQPIQQLPMGIHWHDDISELRLIASLKEILESWNRLMDNYL